MVGEILEFEYPWLSYTAIMTYLSCPRRYKYKYIDLLEEKPSDVKERGIVVHDMIDQFFETVEVERVYNLALRETLSAPSHENSKIFRLIYNTLQEVVDMEDKLMLNAHHRGIIVRSMRSFSLFMTSRLFWIRSENKKLDRDAVAKYWYPVTAEKFFVDDDLKLYGKIDCVFENPDGTYDVIDWKVSGKGETSRDKVNERERVQGRLYLHLFSKNMGIDPAKLVFYIVRLNVQKGRLPHVIEMKHNRGAATRFLKKVEKIRDYIEAGEFPRCTSGLPWRKPVTPAGVPFMYRRVCMYCSYTRKCLGIPEADMEAWIQEQFAKRVLGD